MEDNGSGKVKKAMFDAEQYGAIMSYANSDLKNDFKLLQGEDTVYCHIVHLEPANSIQPIIRMTIGFSGLDTNLKDITLIYNDNIFRNGPLKFHYPKELLESFPEIKLN
jgi:hypothetical protein